MEQSRLTAVAVENGVSVGRLVGLYNEMAARTNNDPTFSAYANVPEMQQIDLDAALKEAVGRENGVLGYRYALAFMAGDEDKLEAIRQEIAVKPAHRYEEIQERSQQWLRQFALGVHLPELHVSFSTDHKISHPTISAEDKALYHELFRERNPAVEALIEKNKAAQADQAITSWAENGELHRQQNVAPWIEQNKSIEFPSITNHQERSNYDAERGKAWYQMQPIAPSADHDGLA